MLQAVNDSDQLAQRFDGEHPRCPLHLLLYVEAVGISPIAGNPHRRSVSQTNHQMVVTSDAYSEFLSEERMMTSRYPDLLRRVLDDMHSW